jgi:hypothetical protein
LIEDIFKEEQYKNPLRFFIGARPMLNTLDKQEIAPLL